MDKQVTSTPPPIPENGVCVCVGGGGGVDTFGTYA